MIAKESQDEPAEVGSLSKLTTREILELLIRRILDAEELLLELKVRGVQTTELELSLARAERDPEVRTEEELGLTEPYPDASDKSTL